MTLSPGPRDFLLGGRLCLLTDWRSCRHKPLVCLHDLGRWPIPRSQPRFNAREYLQKSETCVAWKDGFPLRSSSPGRGRRGSIFPSTPTRPKRIFGSDWARKDCREVSAIARGRSGQMSACRLNDWVAARPKSHHPEWERRFGEAAWLSSGEGRRLGRGDDCACPVQHQNCRAAHQLPASHRGDACKWNKQDDPERDMGAAPAAEHGRRRAWWAEYLLLQSNRQSRSRPSSAEFTIRIRGRGHGTWLRWAWR